MGILDKLFGKKLSQAEIATAQGKATEAKILLAKYEVEESLAALEHAARIDSHYRKQLSQMKRDLHRNVIAPFPTGYKPPAREWLTFFVKFILKNHDIEPVVSAYMAGLPYFDNQFAKGIEEIESAIQSGNFQTPFTGMIADALFASSASNALYVYRNYIATGKDRAQIKQAFVESAHNILDGHEAALHQPHPQRD